MTPVHSILYVHSAHQEPAMQQTSTQTVPATSSVPAQATDRKPVNTLPAPMPISAELLRQISGGTLPNGTW